MAAPAPSPTGLEPNTTNLGEVKAEGAAAPEKEELWEEVYADLEKVPTSKLTKTNSSLLFLLCLNPAIMLTKEIFSSK